MRPNGQNGRYRYGQIKKPSGVVPKQAPRWTASRRLLAFGRIARPVFCDKKRSCAYNLENRG